MCSPLQPLLVIYILDLMLTSVQLSHMVQVTLGHDILICFSIGSVCLWLPSTFSLKSVPNRNPHSQFWVQSFHFHMIVQIFCVFRCYMEMHMSQSLVDMVSLDLAISQFKVHSSQFTIQRIPSRITSSQWSLFIPLQIVSYGPHGLFTWKRNAIARVKNKHLT